MQIMEAGEEVQDEDEECNKVRLWQCGHVNIVFDLILYIIVPLIRLDLDFGEIPTL